MAGQARKVEAVDEADAAPNRARKVSLPVRLTPDQHDALRRIAFDKRVSIHALMLEGVAEVLRRNGK